MSEAVIIPETIIPRKVVVFKPSVEIKVVRNIASKAKDRFFKKHLFMKSKPEETKIDTIDKYFDKYVVIDGKYSIKYSKKWSHSLTVDEEMQKLKIGNKNFEPKKFQNHLELDHKTLMLTGIGHLYKESRLRLIFDSKWNRVGIEQLPYLSFEEDPQDILDHTHKQLTNENSTEKKEVEMLKSKIFKRPNDILKIYDEAFEVTERAIVFKPMYKVSVSHIKTKKKVTFFIDGSNGKISSSHLRNLKPSTKVLKETSTEIHIKLINGKEKINDVLKKIREKTIAFIFPQ